MQSYPSLHVILFISCFFYSFLSFSQDGPPFKIYKFENGLEIVSLKSNKVPLVTIVLASKAGGMTETKDIDGLTHLWEHMFFKGNGTLPNQEAFNKRIRELGIVYNGDTSAEKVRYYFTLPASYLDDGLKFMADAIRTPLLEQKELEKERHVVLNEFDRNASQPGFELGKITKKILYGPLAHRRDALGTRKIIENATRTQLLKIKKDVFVPSNSAILIAGDYSEKKLLTLISKYFSGWKNPKDWKPIKHPKFQKFPTSQRVVYTDERARNVNWSSIYQGPKAKHAPQDTYAADVLISLLSLRTGKFYKKYIDSGLIYGGGLSYATQSQTGELAIYASLPAKNLKKVEKNLLMEPNLWLKPDYFTKQQFEDVRRSLSIGYKYEKNKPSEYIKTVAFWWAITGLKYYSSYLENMKKVTPSDIRAFVFKYFINKPKLSTVFLSPKDAKQINEKDNIKDIKNALNKIQK